MEWCLLTLSTEKLILTRSAAAFEEADHATIDLMTVVLNHVSAHFKLILIYYIQYIL